MKRTSPNVLYVGDVIMAADGFWLVKQVHPVLRAVPV